jgi:hypothetical protein
MQGVHFLINPTKGKIVSAFTQNITFTTGISQFNDTFNNISALLVEETGVP